MSKHPKSYIFDRTRKKYVCFKPEESVRQQVVTYLVKTLGYPYSLITLEKEIRYGSLCKRVDILIREPLQGSPYMLVECKAPHYKLTEKHIDQIAVYNSILQAPWLVITNGLHQLCFQMDKNNKSYSMIAKPPYFHEIR